MYEFSNDDVLTLEGLTVVKFYNDGCLPCKKLETVLLKMEKEFSEVNFISIDIDNNLKLAQNYRIMSVPTLIFFLGSKEINRVQGLIPTEKLRKEFKTFTGKK